ncbi:MAG TPA: shikimate kinase [Actinobacteria bacterium]|nr:shikimate kinase [Actinomycetota bacterium]
MGKIWLIGMMGSGKSTVAPLVGSLLGWDALDTDVEIGRARRRPIPEWFPGDVAEFRAAERTVTLETARDPGDLVVACGGGVVLDPESVAAMRGSGLVVWLDAPVPVLEARIGAGEGRPLLGGDASTALDTILGARLDLYRTAAHAVVSAVVAPGIVAEAVVAAWRNWS